jgi:hypothetical protein
LQRGDCLRQREAGKCGEILFNRLWGIAQVLALLFGGSADGHWLNGQEVGDEFIALLDRGEQHHQACVECLTQLTGPMLTSWPAFTAAIYLLGEAGGWRAQAALWDLID